MGCAAMAFWASGERFSMPCRKFAVEILGRSEARLRHLRDLGLQRRKRVSVARRRSRTAARAKSSAAFETGLCEAEVTWRRVIMAPV